VNQNLPVLPLQDILDNNTALSYFIGTLAYVVIVVLSSLFVQLSFFLEFIGWAGGQEVLFFWLAIEVSRFLARFQFFKF
jgi:hypothetical protein